MNNIFVEPFCELNGDTCEGVTTCKRADFKKVDSEQYSTIVEICVYQKNLRGYCYSFGLEFDL
jgi:hypothetical protein